MKKTLANTAKALALILAALALVALIYILYVFITYSRIDDVTALEVRNNPEAVLSQGKEYSAVTYNVGFGSYSPSFSFFMDTSVWKNGNVTTGLYGKGLSRSDVEANTLGSASVLEKTDADFILLQEVDTPSTRSFGIDMKKIYEETFPKMGSTFAVNFHSSWLNLPLLDPHGIANAGLLTLSSYRSTEAKRISYPVADSLTKVADLDRCFSIQRCSVSNGKELVVINSHMSAYDEGGRIRKEQLEMLLGYMEEEYRSGNYIIVGGDFNHALGEEYVYAFPSEMVKPDWVNILRDEDLPEEFRIVKPENGFECATCRSADIPYTKGVSYETVVDGFIVSDNIEASSIIIDTLYAYSDHQPVLMTFTLK